MAGTPVLIEASDYCVILQDFPNTILNKPSVLQGASDTPGSYEGVSSSLKALIIFPAGKLAANKKYEILFTDNQQAGCWIQAFLQFTNSSILNATLNAIMRVRPIIAPYIINTLTWNIFNSTPPSLGTTKLYTGNIQSDKPTGARADILTVKVPQIHVTHTGTIYGVVIDCTMTTTNYNSIVNPFCELNAYVPTEGGGTKRIYAAQIGS